MQANNLLEYRDIIMDTFKQGDFLPENLKEESKDAPNNFVVEDVNRFTQKIESMSKNINLSLFNLFFESSLIDYAKHIINLKNTTDNKEFVTEGKNRISGLKHKIKKMSEKEKKSADETLKIIKEILDYNRQVQKAFALASKI